MNIFKCCYNSSKSVLPPNISWGDTSVFIPPVSSGRVIKVYDGDTITIATKLPLIKNENNKIWRFSVRLSGIDCPEIRTKDENEKKIAIIARDKLSDKILNQIVQLKNVKLDKYGRLLADVLYNGENLSKWLLNQYLAIEYNGGTKKKINNWERYYSNKLKIYI